MATFADTQYCIYVHIVSGSDKVQNYAKVIYEWPLETIKDEVDMENFKKENAEASDKLWAPIPTRSVQHETQSNLIKL